jgi:hypothetical protein
MKYMFVQLMQPYVADDAAEHANKRVAKASQSSRQAQFAVLFSINFFI